MTTITWDQYDGYRHSDQVSKLMRESLRAKGKFRQFATPFDGNANGAFLNKGDTAYWNVFDTPTRRNNTLNEVTRIPSTTVAQLQRSATVIERGEAIEITGKAELLSLQDWKTIINSALSWSAAAQFDVESFLAFDATPLTVSPASGTSTDTVVLTTNGTPSQTNNIALGIDHVKAITALMRKRNIPPYLGNNGGRDPSYMAVGGVDAFTKIRDDLEGIHQYTPQGLSFIKHGEIGRYDNTLFIEQTMIPDGGAHDSTAFDPWTNTGDAWNNGKSSWAYFFGDDPITEVMVVPEEIRAKVPEDYGRDRGTAWYSLGVFGNSHPDAANARVVKWDSAA
jgi:hypothetical protein